MMPVEFWLSRSSGRIPAAVLWRSYSRCRVLSTSLERWPSHPDQRRGQEEEGLPGGAGSTRIREKSRHDLDRRIKDGDRSNRRKDLLIQPGAVTTDALHQRATGTVEGAEVESERDASMDVRGKKVPPGGAHLAEMVGWRLLPRGT